MVMVGFAAIEKRTPVRHSGRSENGISITDGDCFWTGFAELTEAIVFREANLDLKATRIEIGDPDDEKRMRLFGSAIRDLLAKSWKSEQYARMMRDEDFSLTRPALGLHLPTAQVAAEILQAAGISGWSARQGEIRRGNVAMPHAWLAHEDGTILDLTADRFVMAPVILMAPGEQAIWSHEDMGPAEPPASGLALAWMSGADPDLTGAAIARAREMVSAKEIGLSAPGMSS